MTLATKEWVISLMKKALKLNTKVFVGMISATEKFAGETFQCIDETGKVVDEGKLDEKGNYYLYLSKGGDFTFKIKDNEDSYSWYPNVIWKGAGAFTEPLDAFFYRAGSENDNEHRIRIRGYQPTSGNTMTVDDNYIALIGSGSGYTVGGSNIAFFRVDLTNVNNIYITTSRTNTGGRMYLFATKKEVDTISSDTSIADSSFAVSSYITDAVAKGTRSINVKSLTGMYYVGFANSGAGNNTTYIYDWYWD